MEAFVSRKRRRLSPTISGQLGVPVDNAVLVTEEDSTELKLAILASLHPYIEQRLLLDILLASEGSVEVASQVLLTETATPSPSKKNAGSAYQSSLSTFTVPKNTSTASSKRIKALTKKGRTLHLYSPEDIAAHTPCSIIHNFLPAQDADDLLKELLVEAPTFERQTFKLFDNVVQSPHSACFYVDSLDEEKKQKTEYLYNGSYLTDVRQITPHMRQVSSKVQFAVNTEIAIRIRTQYPEGKKLRFQSSTEWVPNAAFVNCYNGGGESVGYHSDQLTYLGPRTVIGSLSLGVAREFRVRRVVPRDDPGEPEDTGGSPVKDTKKDTLRADAEGQVSIHLPHNSLLVMHAEMQEEWKHSIHPSPAIDPHPIAGNKRMNVTYRCYRDDFHPRYTPRCKCNVATVLRCVQRKKENWGRYFWMCHAGLVPGKDGCTFFQWAEFDDDGVPPWAQKPSRDKIG
ncbi:MAG: hypothetical protein M1827_007562 [Pycnora praestabilis]|nr:MAG: hypothetical protein M1827_007562 [Pycnora praestabilis]